jgi:hypothetical protein
VGVLVDVAVDDEVVGEHGADQDEAVEREREGWGEGAGGDARVSLGWEEGEKTRSFFSLMN